MCDEVFCHPGRQQGRDYYDTIFLLSKTKPNLDFLKARSGISTMEELKAIITKRLQNMDLNQRKGDFAHLLFNEANADRILQFQEVIEGAL